MKVEAHVEDADSVSVGVEGCGLMEMDSGFDRVVYVEIWEGVPRVLIWGDINNPDPTHIIDLSQALETNRKAILESSP